MLLGDGKHCMLVDGIQSKLRDDCRKNEIWYSWTMLFYEMYSC